MLGLLAFFAVAQVPVDQPPRLRTVLPNGAVVLVERAAGSKSLALTLFASARQTPETAATHGHRHLLEHLMATGTSGNLDARVEAEGGFFHAQTSRDAISFEFRLPPKGLKLGIDALRDLLGANRFTPDQIAREAGILNQEEALRDPVSRLSQAAWDQAYGAGGLDPFGTLDSVLKATPDSLRKLHQTTFAANHLAVVVVGNVDLDDATRQVSDLLTSLPRVKAAAVSRRSNGEGGRVVSNVRGEAIALPVKGFRDPELAAGLAAIFAVAAEVPKGSVVYTPTAGPGLITLVAPEGGIDAALKNVSADEAFGRGRELARRWVRTKLSGPSAIAQFRGSLLVQAIDLRPETLLENLGTMQPTTFVRALESLQTDRAVRVVGR